MKTIRERIDGKKERRGNPANDELLSLQKEKAGEADIMPRPAGVTRVIVVSEYWKSRPERPEVCMRSLQGATCSLVPHNCLAYVQNHTEQKQQTQQCVTTRAALRHSNGHKYTVVQFKAVTQLNVKR